MTEDVIADPTPPETRNAVYINAAMTRADCEVNHPVRGWEPYTAQEGVTPLVWQSIQAGTVAPYVPKVREVVAERERRIEAGATLTVTGYGPVQLAGDDATRADLQAQATAAQLYISSGNTTQAMQVRGSDGTVHTLTPAQMLELWSLGAAYIQGIFAASWALEAMDPIPADFAADSRWP